MGLTRAKFSSFDTSTVVWNDPLAVIHNGATNANVDIGFVLNRNNGTVSNVALYWNELGNTFVTGFTPSTGILNSNIALANYANLATGAHTITPPVALPSTSTSTGALVVNGGVGVAGNINAANIVASAGSFSSNLNVGGYSNVFITTGSASNASALTIAGNVYGRGGLGYLDALQLTNTYSGATNPNKYIRLNSTGGLEIVNNAYTSTILSLSDGGDLSVSSSGKLQVGGKQAVNGPAFSAYADGSAQTIANDTNTKVLFQTEEFDTNSNFTSSRFTPTVEGYYQLNASVRITSSSGTGECMIMIYKNGNIYKRGHNESGTEQGASFWSMEVSSVVYANGTTDYFEIYVRQGSGASRGVTAVNDASITYFNGCMLRGA